MFETNDLKKVDQRSAQLFNEAEKVLHVRTDRLFGGLLFAQWIGGLVYVCLTGLYTWNGASYKLGMHFWAALLLGGLIVGLPIFLSIAKPGEVMTRHTIAAAQMLMGALFIHLANGRIEAHFHVFGSLAFLAFYKDWKVLITASLVVAVDHLLRGALIPQSVFGVAAASPWRSIEHASWVIFEDVFLIYSCLSGRKDLRELSHKQGTLEVVNFNIEEQIKLRTQDLVEAHKEIETQRAKSVDASKMAALGEMAGGIAHEINNPLAVIQEWSTILSEVIHDETLDRPLIEKTVDNILSMCKRIAKIVSGLRSFSRDGTKDPFKDCGVNKIIEDTLALCQESFKGKGIPLTVEGASDFLISCRATEISQVLLNLLNNAKDAIEKLPEKWIKIECHARGQKIEIGVTDSGRGVPKEIQDKVYQPFFTTKEIGKGTGLGLSISNGIIKNHHGELFIDNDSPNTKFVIRLPVATGENMNPVNIPLMKAA